MTRTFKYRIYPSRSQKTKLNKVLLSCQRLYNKLLEERISSWKKEKKSLSKVDQIKRITELKKSELPSLKDVHSQVLQNVAIRVDLAFQHFFRRLKAKECKAGFPRFKSISRYDSFTYPQSGFKILADKALVRLSKIGSVKIKLHRPIEGDMKTCTIKRTPTGKWFVSFTCVNVPRKRVCVSNRVTGIDLGVESFAVLSNGTKIPNPKFFSEEEKTLAKAQRKLSTQKKGTKERAKARKVVAKIHERIKNKRNNFVHQLSAFLVKNYKLIVAEDINIKELLQDNFRTLRKSISDAAWSMLLTLIEYKAEEAGTQFIRVNPAYTSQTCARCGYIEKKKLSQRKHRCSNCGYTLHRDHNAAINILRLGTQSLHAAYAV